MIGVDAVTRHRIVDAVETSTALPPALFAPTDTAPATPEGVEPSVAAPTLYWFGQWPDVRDTDQITVRGVRYDVHVTPADWRGQSVGGLVVRLRVTRLDGLSVGRREAEAAFTETFTAFMKSKVLNESTGLYAPSEAVLYAGVKGSVDYPTLTVSELEQGAQVPAVQDVHVKVAVGATPDVVTNVYWRVTGSVADPSLVGREYRTKGRPQSGFVTTHDYPVEEVS